MVKLLWRQLLPRLIALFFYRHRKAFHVVIKDHTNRLSYLEDPTGNELYRVNVFPKTGISLNPEWEKEDKRSISDQSLRSSKLWNFPQISSFIKP